MQEIQIIGQLGRDPEMRYSPDGKPITKFSIATNTNDKIDGEWKPVTTWWNVVVFGKQAESCNQYLTKGKKVFVRGTLLIHTYEKKNGGGTGISNDVTADKVEFLSPKSESEQPTDTSVSGVPFTTDETQLPF